MKVAQLAPLWEPVPPITYGGTELVVHNLTEELVAQGHDVTLFACGQSNTSAKLFSNIQQPLRKSCTEMYHLYEAELISMLLSMQDNFDIIHNHTGPSFLPYAHYLKTPIVSTMHNAFNILEEADFIKKYSHLPFISISDYQRVLAPELNYVSTVYNGINIEQYEFKKEPDANNPYLLFLGRICIEKGAHLAIKLAKETGHRLIMAGKIGTHDMDFYNREIKHLIDNEQIIYIGEVNHSQKVNLFKNAIATVHPITWPEPFGLVLTESMACGTPVLALKDGSIPEVMQNGITGFIEDNIEDLIKKTRAIPLINRRRCREHVEKNFTTQNMVKNYINVYEKIISQKITQTA